MKKAAITTIKFIIFFIGWAICASILDIPFNNPALWRFGAELIPLLSIILFSFIFWLLERQQITIAPMEEPAKNLCLGIGIGLIWLGFAIGTLYIIGIISFTDTHSIDSLWLWTLSCLLNVIMQELLVRGYLFQLIKKKYNVILSTIITTTLFTLCHGGALEAGVIPVLNIVTMSIFMTLLLEYYQSIIVPIMIHFVWNYFGAIIFNSVTLADDYPSLFEAIYNGSQLLSGGTYKLEGSIVVLVLNCFLIVVYAIRLLKQKTFTEN